MRPSRLSPLHISLHVLVASGDVPLSTSVGGYLQVCGHVVDFAGDGNAALAQATEIPYDALLIDVGLRGVDGLSLCRRLRESPWAPSITMVSEESCESVMLAGFDAGADDYLVKPFSFAAMHARLQALARRGRSPALLSVGDLRFNPSTLRACRGERRLELPPSSIRLLHRLLLASPGLVTRETAIRTIWGDSPPDGDGALRAHIHTLRTALEAPGEARLLHTQPGVGYRLSIDEDE